MDLSLSLIFGMLNANRLLLSCCPKGTIPTEVGMLGDVDFMYLNENKFTGSISEELAGLLDADDLFLFGNQLTGKCALYITSLAEIGRS